MKNQLLSVLLLTITVLFQQARSAPDQIIELFRHGARSPLNNLDHSWHDYVTLTPVGYRQHYILGKVLSKKYSDLIENAFRNNEVYLFSSNAPRCIQSAGAHLHGMYSSIDKKGVALREDYPREIAVPSFEDPYVAEVANSIPNNEEILYNFFPGVFRIADKVEQYVFNGEQPSFCPKMGELFDKNRKDSYTQEKWKEFEDTINNLNNALHGNYYIRNPEELISYGDPMIADIFDNRTILGGLNDRALIENITWIGTLFYYHFAQSQQIQKELSSFHIVEIFLEQLDNFRKGESYSTAAFFSGHDNNLFALLSAFGIINEECILENFYSVAKNGQVIHPACQYPSFASDIIVEFYNQTQTPHVKMFHKNIPVKICNGKEECDYEEFVFWARNASGNNTRETYFEKCGKNAPEQKPAPLKQKARQEPLVFATKPKVVSSDDSMMIQVGLNVLLVLVCLGLGYKILKDRKKYMRITNERERAYQQQYDINDKSIQDP